MSGLRVTASQLEAKRKGKPLPRPEADIQRAILDYLALQPGIVAWRNNVGAVTEGKRFIRFGVKGLPDIIGRRMTPCLCVFMGGATRATAKPMANVLCRLCRGRGVVSIALYIEVKRPGERPTPEQEAFLKTAQEQGCLAFVATSIDDVIRHLTPTRSA